MALVVLLKGINVGGHRTFRPSLLAKELEHLDVVNVGAAGTFVVGATVSRQELRAEIQRRLPFEAQVMICSGRELLGLTSSEPFARQPSGPHLVRFVSLLAEPCERRPPMPMALPSRKAWIVRIVGRQGRFVYGLHRRQMKAIGCLSQLERVFGVPVTTRSWHTIQAVDEILRAGRT